MPILTSQSPAQAADVVVAGTGFAATFFLHELLSRSRPDLRVIVLERGDFQDHATLIENRFDAPPSENYYRQSAESEKIWTFKLGFGGGSNCWWGNTPRMLPADFETMSRFGQGVDWPFGYDELEPYYAQAEALMAISGMESPHMPMSAAYPLPPHRPTMTDVLLAKAWPGLHGPMPTARASQNTPNRPRCCANGVCGLCPVQSKFTVLSDMMSVYEDPRVECLVGVEVTELDVEGGAVRGLVWRNGAGEEGVVRGDHVVLATNALFNGAILRASNDPSPLAGRRLNEQVAITARVYMDGVDSYQGSTSVTGLGLQLYADEERRKSLAAGLLEINNYGPMRGRPDRWRQVQHVRVVYEDVPQDANEVLPGDDTDRRVISNHLGYGDYTRRAIERGPEDIAKIFAALPVEEVVFEQVAPTESHIQGTTCMGNDPSSSVCDADGLHHRWRDLRILGSSLFPTCPPANPTLTLSALALRAAQRMETI